MFEPPTELSRLDDRARADLAPVAARPPERSWKNRGAGGAAVGIGLLAAKFKTFFVLLLSAKGILLSGFSLIASVWFYSLLFGLKFAVAFIAIIAIHELGHVVCIRASGLPSGLPYFIPGLGAFVALKGRPASAYQSSWIAFGGPLFGALASGAALSYGMISGDRFGYAVAYTGFIMNFFNMLPVLPFDGGRIVEAVSPRIWIAGLALFAGAVVVFHIFNPFIFILVVLAIPQAIKAFRGDLDPAYHALSARQRLTVACAYFLLAGTMFGLSRVSYFVPPGQTGS